MLNKHVYTAYTMTRLEDGINQSSNSFAYTVNLTTARVSLQEIKPLIGKRNRADGVDK